MNGIGAHTGQTYIQTFIYRRLAHGWQHHIGENWHNRATTSGGEYSIKTDDDRVRPKHVLIEFKK
jgi:hypothetical protein